MAKTSHWDSFIIYLVNPFDDSASDPQAPRHPGYPPPPSNALPMSAQTIFYNQAVVLQSLQTAVVSPVMIIRRVDKGNTICGGASFPDSTGRHFTEIVGDPVSQLHKIALEIFDPSDVDPAQKDADHSFLACKEEAVGMHRIDTQKVWVNRAAMPGSRSSATSSTENVAQAAFQKTTLANYLSSMDSRSEPRTTASTPLPSHTSPGSSRVEPSDSSDGGKVKRPRRVSSSLTLQAQRDRAAHALKTRKRGKSLSSAAESLGGVLADNGPASAAYPPLDANGRDAEAWKLDVGDSDIWCIVGAGEDFA